MTGYNAWPVAHGKDLLLFGSGFIIHVMSLRHVGARAART